MKNPNTLRSNATYNGNIEFVDLTDKLSGDVQLQNLARRKCAFQLNEGLPFCDYSDAITDSYNNEKTSDFFMNNKDYSLQYAFHTSFSKSFIVINGYTKL